MLAELLMSAFTPAGRVARRMGLVTASVGLWSRGGRRRSQWEPHHERCRTVVRRAMQGLERRRTALVLGSGLMRDVPAGEISAAFERVILVDAVHLPQVRLAMRARRNVSLVTRDLTGLEDWFSGGKPLRSAPLVDFAADPAIDLVISANLLSQLPLGVEEFMDSPAGARLGLPENLAALSVGWHLDDLRAFGCRICLITDTEMRERNRAGAVTDTLDLLRGHALPQPQECWDWTVAPFGEIDRAHEYVHRVCAWSSFDVGGHPR